MNFSVHMEDRLAEELKRIAQDQDTTRNALINQAVHEFLKAQTQDQWPDEVKRLAGRDKNLPPFESFRTELRRLEDDPLR